MKLREIREEKFLRTIIKKKWRIRHNEKFCWATKVALNARMRLPFVSTKLNAFQTELIPHLVVCGGGTSVEGLRRRLRSRGLLRFTLKGFRLSPENVLDL